MTKINNSKENQITQNPKILTMLMYIIVYYRILSYITVYYRLFRILPFITVYYRILPFITVYSVSQEK